jgi:flagellar biosynthesis/type III secretory pathway protein FliH
VSLPRARVIPRAEAAHAKPHAALGNGARPSQNTARSRVVVRPVAEAHAEAERLLRAAREQAQNIVERARATAHDLILQREASARADALCLVVGDALELRKRKLELSHHSLEQSIAFATLLAERLLGEELQLSPERIQALARQALKEAAGARHAILVAHPEDASELRAALGNLATLFDSIGIQSDDKLSRGQLRVETELGVIEANLGGQLARLAVQLKKILQSHAADTP